MNKNVYSIKRFTNMGATTKEEAPFPVNDWRSVSPGLEGLVTSPAVVDNLEVGRSAVVAFRSEQGIIKEGVRIVRLPDFAQNQVFLDTFANEHVLVSNGRCVLDHSSPEAFQKSHVVIPGDPCGPCLYVAMEAYALRPRFLEDGTVSVGTALRGVDPCYLQEAKDADTIKARFLETFERMHQDDKKSRRGRKS